MHRAFLLVVCVVCLPCVGGCVIPYAYPKLDYTQALQLDAPVGEVRVFRVDSVQSKLDFSRSERETLAEIPVSETGQVATQIKPSLPVGVYLFMGALNYDYRSSASLALRAYRPGFELVEIDSLEQVDHIAWTPAYDLAAQERALDSLLPLAMHGGAEPQVKLEVGSSSPAHRAAILFGAAEYSRLATLADLPDAQTRLNEKARKLNEWAKE